MMLKSERYCQELDHGPTHRAIEAERGFAKRLGANCQTPIAAYAKLENGKLTIDGMVAAASGKLVLRGRLVSDNPDRGESWGRISGVVAEEGCGNRLGG